MKILPELKYTKHHEWVRIEGNKVYIGITDFGQDDLGDIFFLELPDVGKEYDVDDVIGATESAKAVSSLISPVKGKVAEVNEVLSDAPDQVNCDPYESWILAMELTDDSGIDKLMNSLEYEKYCEQEG